MHAESTRPGEAVVRVDSERIQQLLLDKQALRCPQCGRIEWGRAERVALIPLDKLPRDTSMGGPALARRGAAERAAARDVGEELAEAARRNAATRLVCGHCGNVMLIDEATLERGS